MSAVVGEAAAPVPEATLRRPDGPGPADPTGGRPRLARLATAMVVDSFGSGLAAPFGLLYAHVVVGLSLATAGVTLAAAGLGALALGPVAGALVDRYGAARVAATGNLLAAAGAATLLLARDLPSFAVGAFLGAAAARVFWAAFAPLVGDAVAPAAREKWFGLLRGSRYAGMAAGGLLASAALMLGQHTGLLAIVAVDALSYLLAAGLIATAGITPYGRRPVPGQSSPSYRVALHDATNLVLVGLNVLATLLITAPLLAMPVFVLSVLDQPAWLPGVLAGAGTGALAVGVTVAHRVTAGRGRLRVLAAAGVVWAAGALAYAASPVVPSGLVVPILLVAAVAIGLGEALYGPTADTLPLVLAGPGLAGRYTALHQVAWGISGAVAPALVGLLSGRPHLLWLVLAVIAAGTAAVYRALPADAHRRAAVVGATPPDPRSPDTGSRDARPHGRIASCSAAPAGWASTVATDTAQHQTSWPSPPHQEGER